jgi:DNA-binding PadR family transcriptional regulator
MFGQFRDLHDRMHEMREEHCREHGRSRHFRGGYGRGWEGSRGFEHGFGGGRERFFDSGHLQLVILQLISEKPSYGYEIIKTIEERLSGGYTPSPGVVYPTLTLLEEEGLVTSSTEGNKKLYTVTEQGTEHLKANNVAVKAIFGRMDQAQKVFGRGRSPQIMRAMMNLQMALRMRAGRGGLNAEQVSKIAAAIDAAARTIDEA